MGTLLVPRWINTESILRILFIVFHCKLPNRNRKGSLAHARSSIRREAYFFFFAFPAVGVKLRSSCLLNFARRSRS